MGEEEILKLEDEIHLIAGKYYGSTLTDDLRKKMMAEVMTAIEDEYRLDVKDRPKADAGKEEWIEYADKLEHAVKVEQNRVKLLAGAMLDVLRKVGVVNKDTQPTGAEVLAAAHDYINSD